ncbi:hypothetical protein EV138_6140 [Kribbella voronezhensis]|uniref:Photosynthesis system II assembly factor YCF48-like protein n=1 Tax=Kribbella voronezhensis TaxID=2512212 RepID=A0A4R7SY79_9ACTN|nr:hypothetical protein [Kribbella voronezhensis]TDU83676.1 hypothetical protein EV138_6140 [Kribbella voronezhensis]
MRLHIGRSAIALAGAVTAAVLLSSGATAQPSAVPEFAPQSIVWPTPSDGYLLGGIGCGTTTCPAEVRATHNGGKTWTTVGRPHNGLAKSGEPGLTSLQFANQKFGWAYDPFLEATSDGGRTWTQVPLPGGAAKVLNLLAAPDGTYVVTSDCEIGSGVCDDKPLRLWRAPAGKTTGWQPVNVTVGADENAVFAAHGSTVYVLVAPFVAPGRLSTLRDGKVRSTSTVTCADAEDAIVTALAANADNRLFVLCNANFGRGHSEKTVMVSGDGGRTFRYDGVPGTLGLGSELAVGADGAVMVSTVTASLVYNRPALSKSWRVDDKSWLENSEHLHDLVFQSPTTAWLVERDAAYGAGTQLWVTHDAGTTWHRTQA